MRRRPAAVRSLGPLGVLRRINARSDSGLLMDQPPVPSAGHTGRRGPGGSGDRVRGSVVEYRGRALEVAGPEKCR